MTAATGRSLESIRDCEDFLSGCLFMATGGGGSPAAGLSLLAAALEDGLQLGWIEPDEVDDGALTATVFGMGSIAPTGDTEADLMQAMHLDRRDGGFQESMAGAVRALSDFLGERISCLVAVELGAANTPGPIVAAARLAVDVVDGDYSGRAVPEEMQSTPFAHGLRSDPLASVDCWGSTAVVTSVANPYMLERIGRHLAMAGIVGTSVASTPLRGADMKRILVPGTLSLCLRIGRACREAVEAGRDPVDAALAVAGGWRLFDGVVSGKNWEDTGGFMIGSLRITGIEGSAGRAMRAWFKNEIHVTWLDDEPWVCTPDLVTLVDPATGRGFTNADVAVGDRVTAVGMQGLGIMRTEEMLANASGPEYFGLDVPYVPIEELTAG